MTTFKPVIIRNDQYLTAAGMYNVKIRVSHNTKVRYISTDHYILSNQIDDDSGIIKDHPNASFINANVRTQITDNERILLKEDQKLIERMDIKDIMNILRKKQNGGKVDFLKYLEQIETDLKNNGSEGYASLFGTLNRSLKEFHSLSNLYFIDINYLFLQRYERWLIGNGCKPNGVSIYMRNIRKAFNQAIKEHLVSKDEYPFGENYKIPKGKVFKRNIDVDLLIQIRDSKLKSSSYERARDLFMLSFYLIGANFKDLLLAPKSAIKRNGRFVYFRAKTDEPISIKIEPEAMAIINKYRGEKYMLDFMDKKEAVQMKDNRSTQPYKDVISQTNKRLKSIFKDDFKIEENISTYYARHTWSTIARRLKINLDDISLALGHTDTKTRSFYVEEDLETIDKANRVVLDSLNTNTNVELEFYI